MSRSRSMGPRSPIPKTQLQQQQSPSLRPSIFVAARGKKPLQSHITAGNADNAGFNSERSRQRMVQGLQGKGISHPKVLEAMLLTPRHLFVDAGLASHAYFDDALPIGHGQTISQPYIVAFMLETLMRSLPVGAKLNRLLEVGTGCGYQAAVASHLAHQVVSIERILALHDLAAQNLQAVVRSVELGQHTYDNIVCVHGDGMLGAASDDPYDAIIFAAAGHQVPAAVLTQMALGGRCIAPVVAAESAFGAHSASRPQTLQLIERIGAGTTPDCWRTVALQNVHFVPLKSGVL